MNTKTELTRAYQSMYQRGYQAGKRRVFGESRFFCGRKLRTRPDCLTSKESNRIYQRGYESAIRKISYPFIYSL